MSRGSWGWWEPARRRRSLAGDARAGSYARGLARRAQYAFMRRNWLFLLTAATVAALAIGIAALLVPYDFARGVVVGGGLVGVGAALWQWVVQATGTGSMMMGDHGEQWTAGQLRRLRRRGWLLVNHVFLSGGDIDHVLVGPGGVIAVETKWTAEAWHTEPRDERIAAAAAQAQEQARRLSHWHDLKSLGTGPVRPAVFLWGAGATSLEPVTHVESVEVISGPRSRTWMAALPTSGLTSEQVSAAWAVLDERCRVRDELEQEQAPLPPSMSQMWNRLVFGVVAGCLGFWAGAFLVSRLPWPWAVAACLVLFAAGWAARRLAPARTYALAWMVGVAGVAVVGAAAAIAQQFV